MVDKVFDSGEKDRKSVSLWKTVTFYSSRDVTLLA